MSRFVVRDKVLLIAFLVASLPLLALMAFSLPTNHDEYQYISAAELSRNGELYGDFFYSQTPYYAILLGWLIELFAPDGNGVLVASRSLTLVWAALFLFVLMFVLVRIAKDTLLSVALCTVVLTSTLLDLPLRTARNDMMPLALATLALALVVYATDSTNGRTRSFVHLMAGALLSAAVCTKQSYIFVVIAFAAYAVIPLRTKFLYQLRTAALPMAVGGIVAAIPASLTVFRHLQNFMYSNGEFHQTSHLMWHYGKTSIGIGFRIRKVIVVLMDPAVLVLCVMAAVLLAIHRRYLLASLQRCNFSPILVLTLVACLAVTISLFLASPLHPQYAAPILPFLATFVVAFYASSLPQSLAHFQVSPHSIRLSAVALSLIAVLSSLALSSAGIIPHLRALSADRYVDEGSQATWSRGKKRFITEHAQSARVHIRGALGNADKSLKIATLMPSYPIEAGFGVYEELAGSPFFYRVNDRLSSRQLRQLRGLSPRSARAWLASVHAEAVLVGYRADLEAGFVEYATLNRFKCYSVDLEGSDTTRVARLYVSQRLTRSKPDC